MHTKLDTKQIERDLQAYQCAAWVRAHCVALLDHVVAQAALIASLEARLPSGGVLTDVGELTDADLERYWAEAVKDRPDLLPSDIRRIIGAAKRARAMVATATAVPTSRSDDLPPPHVTVDHVVESDMGAPHPRPHLIDGEFQSDKYPTTPRGKVPLSVKDPTAQDLLWEYAQRRRAVDAEFSDDLETALRRAGYVVP